MTIEQTVEIPVDHRLTIEVPREIPAGRAILAFTPAAQTPLHPCPICAAHIDPVTGNPRYNAETVAAIEEGIAISNGEIPVKWYTSTDEMWEDLMRDDPDDPDD